MAGIMVRLGLMVFLAMLAIPQPVDAQPTKDARRIGFLASGSSTVAGPVVGAFRAGLRELGWVEGQNVTIEFRFAEGRFDRLPDLAAELVRLEVDLIVAVPTPAALAAKSATATIPIVMISVTDPVGIGLVASLARPGRNVTGGSFSVGIDIIGKQLQLLKEAFPQARSVAILVNPTNPGHALALGKLKADAKTLGLSLQFLEAAAPNEFNSAFAVMAKDRVDALLVIADAMFSANRTRIAELAAKYRLPSVHTFREYVGAGGVLSYGPNLESQYRQATVYVDKILRGAMPAELPIEQPTKFELVINLKTAKALGITIPHSLVLRADEVIQ
jgi:putative tryptophan/tyrosine transport system substrate-binding protein